MLDYEVRKHGNKTLDNIPYAIPVEKIVMTMLSDNINCVYPTIKEISRNFGMRFLPAHLDDEMHDFMKDYKPLEYLINNYLYYTYSRTFSDDDFLDVLDAYKRIYSFMMKIENKSRREYAHKIVGIIHPSFYADAKAYYITADIDNIETLYLHMLFHTILLRKDIEEYIIYDYKEDKEYILKEFAPETIKQMQAMVKIFQESYYATLYERETKETFGSYESQYSYSRYKCPCGKGNIEIKASNNLLDVNEFTRFEGTLNCEKCKETYMLVTSTEDEFFLEGVYNPLNF